MNLLIAWGLFIMNRIKSLKLAITFNYLQKRLTKIHNESYVLKLMKDILDDCDLFSYSSDLEKQFIKYFNLLYEELDDDTRKQFIDTLNGGLHNEVI